jgi:hydrogenase/urease accessory protein HupE
MERVVSGCVDGGSVALLLPLPLLGPDHLLVVLTVGFLGGMTLMPSWHV